MSDTKKLYRALYLAGLGNGINPTVFNDKAKNGTRRLKVWFGSYIFSASPDRQQELERQLKLQFRDRYLYGMFIRASDRIGGKSFIVRLVA